MKKQYKEWINEALQRSYLKYLLILFAGLALGWLFFHSSDSKDKAETTAKKEVHEHKHTIWTCSTLSTFQN